MKNLETKLIKSVRIITNKDDYIADILIEKEKILSIDKNIEINDEIEIINAEGLLAFPGAIDCHTHLENKFGNSITCDTFDTGTKAAAFGGTTTIIDFSFKKNNMNAEQAIENSINIANRKAAVDYSFHLVLTKYDKNTSHEIKQSINELGISSFKMFMAYPAIMADDLSIYNTLKDTGPRGGLVCIHAENGPIIDKVVQELILQGKTQPKYHAIARSSLMEGEATNRVIKISELVDSSLNIFHVSCDEALQSIIKTRENNNKVTAETCPHYLYLDDSVYESDDFDVAKYVCSPPIRSKKDQIQLWNALKDNILQIVSTDHCPFMMKEGNLNKFNQKPLGKNDFSKIPNGVPGIESRLLLMYEAVNNNKISLNKFVDLISTTPAKIYGMYPQKGSIEVGSDADIVLFDPNQKFKISSKTHHSNIDYSLYEDFEINGKIKSVFLRGNLIVNNDEWVSDNLKGKFIKRGQTTNL